MCSDCTLKHTHTRTHTQTHTHTHTRARAHILSTHKHTHTNTHIYNQTNNEKSETNDKMRITQLLVHSYLVVKHGSMSERLYGKNIEKKNNSTAHRIARTTHTERQITRKVSQTPQASLSPVYSYAPAKHTHVHTHKKTNTHLFTAHLSGQRHRLCSERNGGRWRHRRRLYHRCAY